MENTDNKWVGSVRFDIVRLMIIIILGQRNPLPFVRSMLIRNNYNIYIFYLIVARGGATQKEITLQQQYFK